MGKKLVEIPPTFLLAPSRRPQKGKNILVTLSSSFQIPFVARKRKYLVIDEEIPMVIHSVQHRCNSG